MRKRLLTITTLPTACSLAVSNTKSMMQRKLEDGLECGTAESRCNSHDAAHDVFHDSKLVGLRQLPVAMWSEHVVLEMPAHVGHLPEPVVLQLHGTQACICERLLLVDNL